MDADYYNDISDQIKDTDRAKLRRIFQSTLMYIIAYIVITYVQQGTSGLVARLMNYEPVIRYFGIYHMPVSPTLWTKWSVLLIFGSGPFMGLVVGLTAYKINGVIREFDTMWKSLTLWLGVHGACLFMSYLVTCSFGTGSPYVPFYYGFAVIATWLRMDSVLMAPVSMIGIVALIAFGLNVVVPFLSLCYSRPVAINYRARRGFLMQVAVLPWLLGSVACIFISLPPNAAMRDVMMNVSKNICVAFIMLGILFRMDHIVGRIQVHSFDIFRKPLWPAVIALIALIINIQWRWLLVFIHNLRSLI